MDLRDVFLLGLRVQRDESSSWSHPIGVAIAHRTAELSVHSYGTSCAHVFVQP